jgi:hypothetical protein
MVRYSFVCRRRLLFGVGITSRTGERVSARPKFLAHHSFHPQSWKNYIHVYTYVQRVVRGCPAEHFAPLLDGIVHLHFYLWLLLPILRHPCCLYNEFVPCLSMFYVCFCCGLDDSTFFKWQSLVNDDGATMMMHRAMAPSIRIQQWLLDFAAKSIQNENNNKPPSIWPASISQLAWGSDAWLEGGQSISNCL